MKRFTCILALLFCSAAPALLAQNSEDHVQVGVFADYLRLSQVDPAINYVGVGGRLAFNLRPSVQLEAEMAYDFRRNFTNVFSDGINTVFVPSNTRPITALFGPKFNTGHGPLRAYVTGKVGLVNFGTSTLSPGAGFRSGLEGISNGDSLFALYPGVGVEGFWGPFGLRLEVGDTVYFNNGAQNNLRVTFGPQIRF